MNTYETDAFQPETAPGEIVMPVSQQQQQAVRDWLAGYKGQNTPAALLARQSARDLAYAALDPRIERGDSRQVPWDTVVFPAAAIEEVPDDQDAAEQALGLDEVYPDMDYRPFEYANGIDALQTLADVVATLRPNEARVTDLYYGLSNNQPLTLAQIAPLVGLTVSRITQIHSRALQKLRTPARLQRLQEWKDTTEDRSDIAPLFGGESFKTAPTPVNTTRHTKVPLPAEQVLPAMWGKFDAVQGLSDIPEPVNRQERLAVDSEEYEKVYRALLGVIEEDRTRNLKVDAATVRRSPFPIGLYHKTEAHFGRRLSPQHLEEFWNDYVPTLIGKSADHGHDVNFDRLGQLMSALLASRMEPEDAVKLHIPEALSGQCGYLGAWARQGHIFLEGDPGDYVGAHMSGTATITVDGNTGAYAGYAAGGHARLYILGQAGLGLGAKARGAVLISSLGSAPEAVAQGITQQATVKADNIIWRSPLLGLEKKES